MPTTKTKLADFKAGDRVRPIKSIRDQYPSLKEGRIIQFDQQFGQLVALIVWKKDSGETEPTPFPIDNGLELIPKNGKNK